MEEHVRACIQEFSVEFVAHTGPLFQNAGYRAPVFCVAFPPRHKCRGYRYKTPLGFMFGMT